MKKNIFSLSLLTGYLMLIFISCHPEKVIIQDDPSLYRKNLEEFSVSKYEYQTFPPMISFSNSKTSNEEIRNEVRVKKEFYRESGLPDETNMYDWKQKKSVYDAIDLFRKFDTYNSGSENITFFRQYGSWIILTKLELLSEKSPQALEFIYSFTESLVGTKYQGYQLLYFSLDHLYQNNFSKSRIKTLGEKILQYATNENNQKGLNNPDDAPIKLQHVSGPPLRPNDEQFVRNYLSQQSNKNSSSINNIQQLVASL